MRNRIPLRNLARFRIRYLNENGLFLWEEWLAEVLNINMETITDIRNGKVWMFRLLNDAETAEPISIKFDQRFDWDYGLINFLRIMTNSGC